MMSDEAFFCEMRQTFKRDARQHVDKLLGLLDEIKPHLSGDGREAIYNGLFQTLHRMKGTAVTIGLMNIGKELKTLERYSADLKMDNPVLPNGLVELFQRIVKEMDQVIQSLDEQGHTRRKLNQWEALLNQLPLPVPTLHSGE